MNLAYIVQTLGPMGDSHWHAFLVFENEPDFPPKNQNGYVPLCVTHKKSRICDTRAHVNCVGAPMQSIDILLPPPTEKLAHNFSSSFLTGMCAVRNILENDGPKLKSARGRGWSCVRWIIACHNATCSPHIGCWEKMVDWESKRDWNFPFVWVWRTTIACNM